MKVEVGTRICSMAGRVSGKVIRICEDGSVIADVEGQPDTIVILPPGTFRLVKPKLTAQDLVLLREMKIGL